jgi:hypothetical protein
MHVIPVDAGRTPRPFLIAIGPARLHSALGVAMPNLIHNLDTKIFRNDSGEFPAIVMGLDIPDADTAGAFLDHVIQQFKNQRMCSPPTTANMTITLTGKMTAERFRDMWTQRSATDPILMAFMSMMVLADVLHIRGRELLDRASLLPTSK